MSWVLLKVSPLLKGILGFFATGDFTGLRLCFKQQIIINLCVLACNLIDKYCCASCLWELLVVLAAILLKATGFCDVTGHCRNALSRKSTSSVIHTVY